jgi:hypothetical protein
MMAGSLTPLTPLTPGLDMPGAGKPMWGSRQIP